MEGVAAFARQTLDGGRTVACKTGTAGIGDTSKNSDAWMVGFTTQVAVASWVGSNSLSPIYNDSGSSMYGRNNAGTAWKLFMDSYLAGKSKVGDAEQAGDRQRRVAGVADVVRVGFEYVVDLLDDAVVRRTVPPTTSATTSSAPTTTTSSAPPTTSSATADDLDVGSAHDDVRAAHDPCDDDPPADDVRAAHVVRPADDPPPYNHGGRHVPARRGPQPLDV